jgi:hypothetical protein
MPIRSLQEASRQNGGAQSGEGAGTEATECMRMHLCSRVLQARCTCTYGKHDTLGSTASGVHQAGAASNRQNFRRRVQYSTFRHAFSSLICVARYLVCNAGQAELSSSLRRIGGSIQLSMLTSLRIARKSFSRLAPILTPHSDRAYPGIEEAFATACSRCTQLAATPAPSFIDALRFFA